MSEPSTPAREATEVVPGVWHWHLADDRIGGHISAAHAVATEGGAVLVDPLPLADEARERIGEIGAIVLTCGSHSRSAWRLRDEHGVPVHVPERSGTLRDRADATYGDGDTLPGGLRAVFTPGAGTTQHTLLLAEPSVAFVPDLFVREEEKDLQLIYAEYADDFDEAKRSAEKLLDLDFDALCLSHGVPVTDDPKSAIRRALAAEG